MADQGLFGLSNFAVNVLLARWLAPNGYGAFVTAFAVFLLMSGFHNALIVEPMSVFGAGRFSDQFSSYIWRLTPFHWALSAALSIPSLLIGLAYRFGWSVLQPQSGLSSAFLAISASTSFILFFWMVRRACYARLLPRLAATGSAGYLLTILGGLLVLRQRDVVSIGSALAIMGAANLIWGGFLFLRLIKITNDTLSNESGLWVPHWRYGRWVIATTLASWTRSDVYYVVLPRAVGLGATGALRALMSFVTPMTNVFTALGTLLVPTFVNRKGRLGFQRAVWWIFFAVVIVSSVYWALLTAVGPVLVVAVLGAAYRKYTNLLAVLGMIPVFMGGLQVLTSVFRSYERPDLEFRAQLASGVGALTVGIGLVLLAGTTGAALGLVLTSAAGLGLAVPIARHLLSQRTPD